MNGNNMILPSFDAADPKTREALQEMIREAVADNRAHLEEANFQREYLGSALIFLAKVKAGLLMLGCDPQHYDIHAVFDLITEHLKELAGESDISAAWHQTIGTEDSVERQDDPIDFFYAYWPEISPYTGSPLEVALRHIGEYPDLYDLDLPPHRAGYARFLALCHALCRYIQSQRFYLPRGQWAGALGCSKAMITKYTRMAQRDEILRMVKPADPPRLAATFQIDTDALHERYKSGSGLRSV